MNWSLISIFFSLLLTPFFVYSQVDSIQLQINQDVWYPFMESYASFNDKEFMSIHTDDIIRISRDGQRIQVGEEYAKSMAENAKWNKERKRTRTIEFSFLERFSSGGMAFEVGYYKVISMEPEKEPKNYYGIFQVVLKNIDGKWKLLVDSDTSINNSLTEEDFLKGTILR
ncbi:MAG: DUF4440 domain-containing protein [Saprospiraceae bacterium]|jgi:ketosteroid isomerase-like protein|nr:DUF4440 domain-containing protein [Saprospiraceae bacterium]